MHTVKRAWEDGPFMCLDVDGDWESVQRGFRIADVSSYDLVELRRVKTAADPRGGAYARKLTLRVAGEQLELMFEPDEEPLSPGDANYTGDGLRATGDGDVTWSVFDAFWQILTLDRTRYDGGVLFNK